MIVLQAGLLADEFLLWGETPTTTSKSSSTKKRKTKAAAAATLPFGAAISDLNGALKETLPEWSKSITKGETASIWLPTVEGQPLASTPLIAEPPVNGASPELRAWTVMVLPLPSAHVIDLLCACMGKQVLQAGVMIGKTLAFWANGLRLAGSLVAREQFLPSLDRHASTTKAVWEPILAADGSSQLQRLAEAMPAACRAFSRNVESPPDIASKTVLTAFVNKIVDALVRSTIAPVADVSSVRKTAKKKTAPSFDSVHDEWLYALRTADGLMQGHKAEQGKLFEQIHDWRRPVLVSTVSPFRLCFRLEEPQKEENGKSPKKMAANGNGWYLRYMLQAADDPSLLVPVTEGWKKRLAKTSVLNRGGFQPREFLLTTLGEASAVYPHIESSLSSASPEGVALDVNGAFGFLTEQAWLLEQAGFGVLLPAWWSRKGTKQRLTVRANAKSRKTQRGSGVSLNTLITFDWQVALGDEILSVEELQELARLKAPLVKVRGQWVQVSAQEIQAALDFWKNKGEMPLRELVQMALGGEEAADGLQFGGVQATGWIQEFLDQLQGRAEFESLEPPDEFHGTLRPYQTRGYSWLGFLRRWGLGACLADDMGLGKTVQTLALLQREWRHEEKPALLICPMSVVGNWQKEAERFTPELPVLVHHGLKRIKGKAFRAEAEKYALIISSYSLLHRDFELFKEVPWRAVILDEAQNIKNPETKQAGAARNLSAEYRIGLTGTPVENHVGDLWSIMEFLNPGFLGNRADFRRRFLLPIQAHSDPEASENLKRLTGPFILRRLKTDKSIIADLPDKMEMKVFCNLTKEQASLYAAVVEEANQSLEETEPGIKRRGMILGILSKLKQVCNHPAQLLGDNSAIPGRSGKLARLTEMLEEILEVGDRTLIFTQFTEMGEIVKRHLEETFGQEVLFLHGGVTKKKRDRMVARFQDKNGNGVADRAQIFLLSLKAGGTGLNLTAANHVFHFDRWWNPAVENQATDRAFRIGQTRNVQVHKFLCVGTLEERIDEMIAQKQEVAEKVVGAGEGWLTELSNEQLRDLFTLRKEALAE